MSAQILMIASNLAQAQRLEARLGPLQMQLRRQIGAPDHLQGLFTPPPQLVIIDVTAARPDDPPLEMLQALRRHPESEAIPRLAWGVDLDPQARVAALRAGAHEVCDQTTPQSYLFARIRNLLRARLANDDLDIESDSLRLLAGNEVDRSFVPSGRTTIISHRRDGMPPALRALAKRLPNRNAPQPQAGLAEDSAMFIPASPHTDLRDSYAYDLIVIDFMPQAPDLDIAPMQLGRTLAGMRARPATRGAKILVMLPAALPNVAELAELAMDLGADDLVTDHVGDEELGLRVRALLHAKAQTDRQRLRVTHSITAAMTDPLTGLNNRRIAMLNLRHLAERQASFDETYTVALIDIDHFKSVNDRFGHAVGDVVLAQMARILRANLRAIDLVARFGGEEFLVALPQTRVADAMRVIERLRQIIAATPIPLPAGEAVEAIHITISAGVAEGANLCDPQSDLSHLWREADRALYLAKAAGRDRVVQAQPAPRQVAPPLAI